MVREENSEAMTLSKLPVQRKSLSKEPCGPDQTGSERRLVPVNRLMIRGDLNQRSGGLNFTPKHFNKVET